MDTRNNARCTVCVRARPDGSVQTGTSLQQALVARTVQYITALYLALAWRTGSIFTFRTS